MGRVADPVLKRFTALLVERNFIQTVRAPDPEIGYGIQVKLNSVAVIRDNVIADTKGPGIMVHGAHDVTAVSVVERNVVTGSLGSSRIVVGGGRALVRNNVAVANREAGIALEDHGRRGLLRGIAVAHNTVASPEILDFSPLGAGGRLLRRAPRDASDRRGRRAGGRPHRDRAAAVRRAPRRHAEREAPRDGRHS